MPVLTILAGPNGAGKTRISDFLLSANLFSKPPVDLDFLQIQAINQLPHSIYGAEERLKKSMDLLFADYCKNAISNSEDFCYECNFRKDQLKYVELFENAGYKLNLIYLLLDNIEQSEQRVAYRVANENGRFVDKASIIENFSKGLFNLDNHYGDFHQVTIIDSSADNYRSSNNILKIKLEIDNQELKCYDKNFPKKELASYLPNIAKLVSNYYKLSN